MEYIHAIENALGMKADKELLPLQPGDVLETYADVEDLVREFDYQPTISINEGISKFIKWYRSYYKV